MSIFDPVPAGFVPQRLARLATILQRDVDANVISGAVLLVARNGHLAQFEAFGFADRETRRPMQTDSLFRIASLTKPITVVAALLLMEAGELSLDDPVSRYIPAFSDLKVGVERHDAAGASSLNLHAALRPMTVQDLMRHTAGFTYGYMGDSMVQQAYRREHLLDGRQSNAELVRKLATLPLAHQPGTTFEYGMSTDVLGHVVEIVAHMTLDDVIERRITRVLAMHDTSFAGTANGSRLAQPRALTRAQGCTPVRYDPAESIRWLSGGGGLLSTAGDFFRFCQMLLCAGEIQGVRLLARTTVNLMLQNQLPSTVRYGQDTAALGSAAPLPALGQGYAMGLGVRTEPGLGGMAGSKGDFYWGGASGPYFWVDPQEKLIVIFMLQELDHDRRAHYRPLLRKLIYQALV